jgi:hypothetical protein
MRLINSDSEVVDARVIAQDGGNAASARIDNAAMPLTILAVVLSCMSFIGMFWALSEAKRASTRADLAELEVESFKNVLHSRGMPTSVHLEGEKP